MTFYYPAVIRKHEPGKKYHVDFLDLDDCYGEGETESEALQDAREAALEWIHIEQSEGNDLPLQTVMADYNKQPGEKVTLIQIIMHNDWLE